MNLERKVKSKQDLIKELDRLVSVFQNLTKEIRKRSDIEDLEEDFQKAQLDLDQFWKKYAEYTKSHA